MGDVNKGGEQSCSGTTFHYGHRGMDRGSFVQNTSFATFLFSYLFLFFCLPCL